MNASTSPITQEPEVIRVAISLIRRDGGTQPRAAINQTTVTEYAQDMKEGAIFPPVVVFYDGTDYWLSDGFHRVEAAESIGWSQIAALVRQGTRREAVLYSVGVNTTHGLRRSNADKRRAVMTLLEDSEWSQWSNNEIAKRGYVSHTFVNNLRSLLETVSSEPRTYVSKHGTTAEMNVAKIGKNQRFSTTEKSQSHDTEARQTFESLSEGDCVIVKESNSLLAGQTGIVTVLPNPSAAIVELDGGERELIARRDLEKSDEQSLPQTSSNLPKGRREGINYQPNGYSEYYVRVSKTMWKRLEEYQQRVGAATMEGAIERLFASAASGIDL